MTEVLEEEFKYCLYARKSTEGDEKQALSIDSQIKEMTQIAESVALMKTKFEVVDQMYHGFDYNRYFESDIGEQLQTILDAQEHILAQPEGEKRYKQNALELSKAFALSMPRPEALELRKEVAFFQAVKARLEKMEKETGGPTDEDYRLAIRQIVDKAVAPIGVVDVFEAAGLDKPELSILSDEFLSEIKGMKRKNLAVEALNKLLNDEIKVNFSKNAIKMAKFSDLLEDALQKYKNGTIEAAQVVELLIDLAKEMRDEVQAGEGMGLSYDERAFYDALIDNGSALDVMGDDTLRN